MKKIVEFNGIRTLRNVITLKIIITMLLVALPKQNFANGCRIDTIYNFKFSPSNTKLLTGRTINQYYQNDLVKEYIVQSWIDSTKTWNNEQKGNYTYNSQNQPVDRLNTVWDPNSKTWKNMVLYNYTYDAAGNNTAFVYNSWNATQNKWEGISKNNYVYDKKKNVLEYYNQKWDKTSNSWLNQGKQEHKFDTLNNEIEYTTYNWLKASNVWEGQIKLIKQYNSEAQISLQLKQGFLPFYQTWVNGSNTSFTYNSDKKIIKLYELAYSNNNWKPLRKLLYYYDSALNNTSILTHTNDTFIGVDTVYLTSKELNKYDSVGNMTESMIQIKNVGVNTFRNDFLAQYKYDANSNRTEEFISTWDTLKSTWIKNYRYLYLYNSDTNVLNFSLELWSPTQQWTPNFENKYEYNLSGQKIAFDRFSVWDTISKTYGNHTREEYVCKKTSLPTSVETSSLVDIVIYPNPSVNGVFELMSGVNSDYSVIDINGKEIKTGCLVAGNNTIDLNYVVNGLYFLRTSTKVYRLAIQRN